MEEATQNKSNILKAILLAAVILLLFSNGVTAYFLFSNINHAAKEKLSVETSGKEQKKKEEQDIKMDGIEEESDSGEIIPKDIIKTAAVLIY